MDKKELNKIYYAEHKEEIARKLYKKENCDCCGRTVSHQNMVKHKRTKYCQVRTEQQKDKQILDKIKSNINKYNAFEDFFKASTNNNNLVQ